MSAVLDAAALIRPLDELDRYDLALAGGKAANLGELIRAGLPVPPGFCITTVAYRRLSQDAGLESVLEALAKTGPQDVPRLEELAAQAREGILAAPVPPEVAAAIARAYGALGATAVAVRSSATAEDLPDASFAGQQDTMLNVLGEAAVLEAVRRCWASLWTDRAVIYRAGRGIDPRTVQLAVVVQQMVDAAVAGVLFTANPLTGRRREAAIDASPGLGEAVVSGAVTPDHFVVDLVSGEITERRLGHKGIRIEALPGGGTQRVAEPAPEAAQTPCLTDSQIRELARLGARVEEHFGQPQDVEWAVDAGERVWLTQARPITTLYPLPAGAPPREAGLRIYFSFNVAQGVFRPLTPMGIQAFRTVSTGIARAVGVPVRDKDAGLGFLVEAGHRLFLDLTALVRDAVGRRVMRQAFGLAEARSAAALEQLLADPRLAPAPHAPWRSAWQRVTALRRMMRLVQPRRAVRAWLDPDGTREELGRVAAEALAMGDVPAGADSAARLDAVERLLSDGAVRIVGSIGPVLPAGLGAMALALRLVRDVSTAEEREAVRRALPHNPTTEMDLDLWSLAARVRADGAAADLVTGTAPEQLAAMYHQGGLPPVLQVGLGQFLHRFGHRGVAEIDLGVPRWAEDPTHILGAMANYLRLEDTSRAPDVQFREGARQAAATAAELARRAGRRSWWRGVLVRFMLDRGRRLAGLREAPKFYLVSLLSKARAQLRPVGEALARAGRLDDAEDIYFLTLPEARVGLAGADLRPLVATRRASYARELTRRRIPRLLLSDGTEPGSGSVTAATRDGVLRGTPASVGVVTAPARVVLDPQGARLEPGEVLVAPSTDPGWTPLFFTAGGLVMEMGGPMSHGAVVAREYGIPAVVGVPDATGRLATGQLITVDGAAGTVTPRLLD